VLESLRADPKLRRCKINFQPGSIQQAATHLGSAGEPDLVLVESEKVGSDLDDELQGLSAHCSPDTRVMLFGPNNDISLYKKLLNIGITDYFAIGSTADQVLTSIEHTFLDVDIANQARVIAFVAANGGAGSSVISANTAFCLAQQHQKQVTLVDLDLPFGTSGLEFDIQSKQSVSDALAQPERLDETLLERFMVSQDQYLSILPSGANLGGSDEVSSEALESIISLLRQMNSYVVLDLPRTWRPWAREILLDCDEVIIVTQPELAGLRNAKNLIDHLSELRTVNRPTRLVINKEGARKKTELKSKDFEKAIGNQPIASIPYDSSLFGAALNNGNLVAATNKRHKITKKFHALAKKLSG
jgi:pilus assembly protein CpaE